MRTQRKCVDGPTTSKALDLDCDDNIFDFDILQCPLCLRQLVPMELDIIDVEGEKFQRIWWTCSGLKTQSCEFPTSLPEDVFWTQRSVKQMRNGFYPLPNLHLLPSKYWHLYPKLFDIEKGLDGAPLLARKIQELSYSMTSDGENARVSSRNVHRDEKENEDCDSNSRLSPCNSSTDPLTQLTSETRDLESGLHTANCERFATNPVSGGNVAGDAVNSQNGHDKSGYSVAFSDSSGEKSQAIDEEIQHSRTGTGQDNGTFVKANDNRENNVVNDFQQEKSFSSGKVIKKSGVGKNIKNAICGKLISDSLMERDSEMGLSTVAEEATQEVGDVSDVMTRIVQKHRSLLQKRKAMMDKNKSLLKNQIKERGYTIDRSVVPYEDLSKPRDEPVHHLPLIDEGIPAEDIIEDKECFTGCEDCLSVLKKPKEEPMDDGVFRRGLTLEGTPTPFRPEHFPSSIIDPLNWYRHVHFTGRTALDGFMSWYNLRFNRKQFMEVLAAELCKQGVMKYVPSIPIKQQRMVKQLHEEIYGKKVVDIEVLKKSFDSSTLRLQMAHRLGLPNVEPLIGNSGNVDKQQKGQDEVGNLDEMRPINSVPITTTNLCTLKDGHRASSFSNFFLEAKNEKNQGVAGCGSFSVPDFSKWNLPEKSISLMSSYVVTGNCEVDEFLQEKVAKQMEQALAEKEVSVQRNNLKRHGEAVSLAAEEITVAKQRRVSEVSLKKEEALPESFDEFLDEYYDEDEEFCARMDLKSYNL